MRSMRKRRKLRLKMESRIRRSHEHKHIEIDEEKEKRSGEAAEHTHIEIDEEKEKSEVEVRAEESEEAWHRSLELFKVQALKMQDISQEAYELYSKRVAVILKETSEKLKIQAEKSSHDLSKLAKDISVEGKEYLLTVAEKSPEQVKDIYLRDGIYKFKVSLWVIVCCACAFLCLGGFLSFMLTGRISGIRFGTILGGTLLALSILSMRSFKRGQSSALALKGEAALLLKQIQIFKKFKCCIVGSFESFVFGFNICISVIHKIVIQPMPMVNKGRTITVENRASKLKH
ncbi:hypothetical protein MKW92_050381 [Papaver armeniacum]|nr:hypothetical protein MKW92_050381 [Papaver armeniacum]